MERGAERPRRRSRRAWRHFRRKLGAVLLPLLGPTFLERLARTWRLQFHGTESFEATAKEGGVLYAIWHGRMLVGLPAHRDRGFTVLVSPSDDGSLMNSLLERFGYGVIRGSSSRGASRALRELLGELERGGRIVITPDGPRGPRHSMNEGLAWMARRTGFPVLPVGMTTDRAWHAASWDHFTIPKRKARVAVVYGEPMRLRRNATDEERAAFTRAIRAQLIALEVRGFRELGVEPDFAPEE